MGRQAAVQINFQFSFFYLFIIYHKDYIEWDEDLMSYRVPEEMEKIFAVAVFEIGLKHSTPKVGNKGAHVPLLAPDSYMKPF